MNLKVLSNVLSDKMEYLQDLQVAVKKYFSSVAGFQLLYETYLLPYDRVRVVNKTI